MATDTLKIQRSNPRVLIGLYENTKNYNSRKFIQTYENTKENYTKDFLCFKYERIRKMPQCSDTHWGESFSYTASFFQKIPPPLPPYIKCMRVKVGSSKRYSYTYIVLLCVNTISKGLLLDKLGVPPQCYQQKLRPSKRIALLGIS